MKKKLLKRIEMLEAMRSKMQARYGAEDELVVDLVQEIKSLQKKNAELKPRLSSRTLMGAASPPSV